MIPVNITTFIVLGGSGFVMEALGSEILFMFCAVLLGGFIVMGKRVMGDLEGKKAKKLMKYRPHRVPTSARGRG